MMNKENPKRQGKPPDRSPDRPPGDFTQIVHELRAHQEQLNTQNDELRRAQLELANANDRYMELFDSAPIGYLALDNSRAVREANLTAATLLGTSRRDLIGIQLSRFMDRKEADAYYLHLTAARDKETRQSCELVLRRPDGSFFCGQMETSPYEDNRFGKGWRIALLDVTLRKETEHALLKSNEELERTARELEKSRSDLRKLASELVIAEERERKRIAGVLHDDIAQTLAAVRMRLDMIEGVPPEHEQIVKEAKALLVESLQEARALMTEVGNPLLFDLGLKAACESLGDRLMRRHPVRIHCNIRDAFKDLSPDVKAVLYQLILELLNNVVKHSKAKNADVRVAAESGQYRVEVADDGLGFDPQILGAPTLEGGLGLYSIRERLLAMKGSLRIESSPGTGTVVTASLPLEQSQGPAGEGVEPEDNKRRKKS
jgi:PAS domain S-box-containing protein